MPAAAKMGGNLGHVDLVAGRAGDDAYAGSGLDDEEDGIRGKQVAQFVRHTGNLVCHRTGICTGDNDLLPVQLQAVCIFQQMVIEGGLLGGERRIEKAVGDAQAGALFQQLGDRFHVPRCGVNVCH